MIAIACSSNMRETALRCGHVVGAGPRGPFVSGLATLQPRADRFDRHHLSAGPIADTPAGPVMFYNGATEDARWRIGWALFDREYTRVLARATTAYHAAQNLGGGTDIAFAASAVQADGGSIWLYYSISDAYLMRATVEFDEDRRP